MSLRELQAASVVVTDDALARRRRACTLFQLTSRMLLTPTETKGQVGRDVMINRAEHFQRGEWLSLLAEARAHPRRRGGAPRGLGEEVSEEADLRQRCGRAHLKVHLGEVSHARQELTAPPLAPGTSATLEVLNDPVRRPRQLSAPIPEDVLTWMPTEPVRFDHQAFLSNVRSSRRGVSGGPSGTRVEHLQTLLDDEAAAELLAAAGGRVARAELPQEVCDAMRFGRMTALRKRDGGVRGIVTGDTLRRLVARSLAQTYAQDFEHACAPFQYALQTRAGTDCVGHMVRAALDSDPDRVVLSLDGIGAYDHIRRAAMLSKLRSLPGASAILRTVCAHVLRAAIMLLVVR